MKTVYIGTIDSIFAAPRFNNHRPYIPGRTLFLRLT